MTDTAITLTCNLAGVGGAATVTASAALFAATDVGRAFSILTPAPERAASTAYSVGTVLCSNYNSVYRLYRVVSAGTTAAANLAGTTPNYDQNAPRDVGYTIPDGGAVLRYLGQGINGWGFGVITGYMSPTQVAVMVDPRGPMPSAIASLRWKLGEWSPSRGYPRAGRIWEGRLVCMGSALKPLTVWASVSSDFENMTPTEPDNTVLDTDALTITIDNDQASVVCWLLEVSRGLVVGTRGAEHLVGPASQTNLAVSPTNVRAKRQQQRGSAPMDGVDVSGVSLFVQRGGQKIIELVYDFATDTYLTDELNQLSEHIAGAGFVEMAYQSIRDGTLWLVRADGVLVSLTYDREQKIRAAARHLLGGTNAVVESVCVVPSPDGASEDIYLSVTRTIGGQTVGTIEYFQQPFRSELDGVNGGYFVDCGLTYSGTPAYTFSGLDHLDGETVQIVADGSVRSPAVVVGGAVTLDGPAASLVHVGLFHAATLTLLQPEVQEQSGTTQDVIKEINEVAIKFYETRGGQLAALNSDGSIDMEEEFRFRDRAAPMSQAYPLYTGELIVQWVGGADREAKMTIIQDQPLPMTILAIARNVTINA